MELERRHPALQLYWLAAVLGFGLALNHPAYIAVSLLSALCCGVYFSRRAWLAAGRLLLPTLLAGVWLLSASGTNLSLPWDTAARAAAVHAGLLAAKLLTAALWLYCAHCFFTADRIVYLSGRLAPGLGLFCTLILRFFACLARQRRGCRTARRGLGLGLGSPAARLRNALIEADALTGRAAEDLLRRGDTLKSRGILLPRRTAFARYPFDSAEAVLTVAVTLCATAVLMAVRLGQTAAVFDPVLYFAPITPAGSVFCLLYGLLCLLPVLCGKATAFAAARAAQTVSSR